MLIDRCEIDHAMQRDVSNEALKLHHSSNVVFSNGSLHDCPPAGPDGGASAIGINTDSRSVRISGNDIYNAPTSNGVYILGSSSVEISGNRVHGCWAGIRISNEGGETGFVVDGVRVFNNLVYHNKAGIDINPHFNDGIKRNLYIVNNTVCYNDTSGITNTSMTAENVVIRNNIVSYNGNGVFCRDEAGRDPAIDIQDDSRRAIIDHNLRSGVIFRYQPIDEFSRVGDPRFCNPNTNNFQVGRTSPAIDAGSSLEAPTVDFLGRPRTGVIDIGAYEGSGCQSGSTGPPSSTLYPITVEPRFSNGAQFTGTFDIRLSASTCVFVGKTFGYTTQQPDCYTGTVELSAPGYLFTPVQNVNWLGMATTLPFTVTQLAPNGSSSLANPVLDPTVITRTELLDVVSVPSLPIRIRFALAKAGEPRLAIFDAAGRKVAQAWLSHSEVGVHAWEWGRTDRAGRAVSNGIYFVVLSAGDVHDQRKIVMLR